MTETTKQNLKQLRVDNWATFFLQRLQLLFAKGDCCDLTLKFHTGQELKVHRLVLNTCTNFFDTLECEDNAVNLPENLPYGVVQPIINFLYSGRLEFKYDLHNQLLSVAKQLNITILAKLLVAQKNDHGTPAVNKQQPDRKQRTFLATRINTPPAPSGPYVNNAIGGRKLPIWRPRTMPLYRSYERKPIKEEEPKPTRFEWPEEGVDPVNNILITSPSFAPLSYDSAPVVPLSSTSLNSSPTTTATASPDSVDETTTAPKKSASSGVKRRIIGSMPPAKKFFSSDKSIRDGTNSVDIDPVQVGSDDDFDDDGHFESIHDFGDSDDEIPPPPVAKDSKKKVQNTPKPILKPVTETTTPGTGKKVRFSLAPEDKENEASTPEKTKEPTPMVATPPVSKVSNEKTSPTPANHAKIIAEVLKKYPDLVKNNKNIKLKISSPTTGMTNTLTLDTKKSDGQSKTSYVVVRPSNAKADSTVPTGKSAVVVASPTTMTTTTTTSAQPVTTWECRQCVHDGDPLKFDTYYDHRKHMEEVHHEKFDSRICEYCAYKTSKRNVLLYHLYTKHNVEPPKSVKFPKCAQCPYIALSDGLLQKHKTSHQTIKELTCPVCRSVFRSSQILQAHAVLCKPNNEQRSFACGTCKRTFRSNVSLNAHMKSCNDVPQERGGGHNIFDDDISDIGLNATGGLDLIEMPVVSGGKQQHQHTYVQLPSGIILADSQNVTLVPSTESDGLNSVATSIGLTVTLPQDQAVILLDGNQEFLFQEGGEAVMVATTNSAEEYIVPEIMEENVQQIYSTDGLQYVSSSDVITCPVEAIPGEEVPNGLDEEQKEVYEECLSGDVIEVPLSEEEREKIVGMRSDTDNGDSAQSSESHHHQQTSSAPADHHILCIVEADPNKTISASDEQPTTADEFIFDDSNVAVEVAPPEEDTHTSSPPSEEEPPPPTVSEPVPELPPPPPSEDDGSHTERLPQPASPDPPLPSSSHQEPESVVAAAAAAPVPSADTPMEVDDTVNPPPPSLPDKEEAAKDDANDVLAEESTNHEEEEEEVVQVDEEEQGGKANSLVKDWGFDNDEETGVEESNDSDPDSGPCRVTVDL